MPRFCDIEIWPNKYGLLEFYKELAAKKMGLKSPAQITHLEVVRRSVDARKTRPRFNLRLQVWVEEVFEAPDVFQPVLQDVSGKPEAYIAGLGPAGLFAALKLISLGIKPIVIERGKPVRPRRRDLAILNRDGIVNPESNYCYGEGGAGTFSDGKLYTRSTKRGNTRSVLDTLVHYGATSEILVDAHPHIGTNKLPAIIEAMREQIIACGGEVHFETRLTGIEHIDGKLTSITVNGDEKIATQSLILATGHSARDIFHLLNKAEIAIEAKPFALGVRVEHPQALIDQIQYHCETTRHDNLPAASYSLVNQVGNKGVYSFCMCPGGIICPATTDPKELVVNGWSPSKRNTGFANSGMVVSLEPRDFRIKGNPLEGMFFQQTIERKAEKAGGGKQVAPAQRLTDFLAGKTSSTLPDCSYLPGISSVDMREVLPGFVAKRLKEGFKYFGARMEGYLSEEAVIVGVESRTSSPVRIPRDKNHLMHPQVAGLFPCGEGAGYAGGIMSAAIDGEKCAVGVEAFFAK